MDNYVSELEKLATVLKYSTITGGQHPPQSKGQTPVKQVKLTSAGGLTEAGQAVIDFIRRNSYNIELVKVPAIHAYLAFCEIQHYMTPADFLQQNPAYAAELLDVYRQIAPHEIELRTNNLRREVELLQGIMEE